MKIILLSLYFSILIAPVLPKAQFLPVVEDTYQQPLQNSDETIRVGVNFTEITGPTGDMRMAVKYNATPSKVQLGGNSIIIKESGLYNLSGLVNALVVNNNALTAKPVVSFTFFAGQDAYILAHKQVLTNTGFDSSGNYSHNILFNFSTYIPANTTIKITRQYETDFYTSMPKITSQGWMTLHKISD